VAIKNMRIHKSIELDWIKSLRSGALLIHPTDTSWAVGASAFSRIGLERLKKFESKNFKDKATPTLLVDSINRLKKHVYQLHPRVETLLNYHHRPLSILYEEVKMLPTHLLDEKGCAEICIVQDHRMKKIIHMLNYPLIYSPIETDSGKLQTRLQLIPKKVKESVDFIYHPSGSIFDSSDIGKPAVVAHIDDEGILTFP
jgi:L-threonylcarbamoyladenylate synthase